MSDPTPAPGWYPAPHANNEQRYWDGAQWLENPAEAASHDVAAAVLTDSPTPVKKARPLGIFALIAGIVAFLTGIVPIVGAIFGAAAIALGIITLTKKQSKGFAIAALILGGLAMITSIGVTAGISAGLPSAKPKPAAVVETTPNDEPSEAPSAEPSVEPTEAPAEAVEEEPSPPASTTPDLNTFYPTDDRSYALVAKDPDSYSGTNIILYGNIMQFDSATGRCAMIISTAATQQEYSFDYETNVMAVSGDYDSVCPVFDPLVENDNVKIWATIKQSFSYDTQIGGNTTVPLVEVWYVELLPATEY